MIFTSTFSGFSLFSNVALGRFAITDAEKHSVKKHVCDWHAHTHSLTPARTHTPGKLCFQDNSIVKSQ